MTDSAPVTHCPRCASEIHDYPALSRVDNRTEICSECGMAEALEDFFRIKKPDPNRYTSIIVEDVS